ncbi:guanine nucleotide exchange factor [Acrasis kona]|uniref:Guanine nucleotide exchange factor n=1 Tax=Acrasis kona TaxID=1008807 RepID=A0AAW2ZAB1_9EUKA
MMLCATVLYEYVSDDNPDFSLAEGDVVVVCDEGDDGWSTVMNLDSRTKGRIPSSYYELTGEEEEINHSFEDKSQIAPTPNVVETSPSSPSSQQTRTASFNSKRLSLILPNSFGKVFSDSALKKALTPTIHKNNMKSSPTVMEPPVSQIDIKEKPSKQSDPMYEADAFFTIDQAITTLHKTIKTNLCWNNLKKYTSRDEFDSSRRRIDITKEIISTEKSYVNFLETLVDVYVTPSKLILSEDVHKEIFSNIVDIYHINKKLLEDLEAEWEKFPSQVSIGSILKNTAPSFINYTVYCSNYDKALDTIERTKSRSSKFKNFMKEAQKDPRSSSHPLNSLMITPAQRLPRYKLLLEDLLKHTNDEHFEKDVLQDVVALIFNITQAINDKIDRPVIVGTPLSEGEINFDSLELSSRDCDSDVSIENQHLKDENESLKKLLLSTQLKVDELYKQKMLLEVELQKANNKISLIKNLVS